MLQQQSLQQSLLQKFQQREVLKKKAKKLKKDHGDKAYDAKTCAMESEKSKVKDQSTYKGVKGNEAGLECDLCHYWFHTKCEGVGADLYKALQKFEEAVRVGRSSSAAIKWYCDSCARTVEKVNGRLLQLEMGQVRLMDEIEKLKEKMNQEIKELKEELEDKLSGCKDKVRAEGEEPAGSSSKLLPIPLKQEITEALDIEKRKDMVVIRGIQERENMDEQVGMIMKELGFSRQYTVMGRIGGLRKKGAEESDIADIGRNRLVSLKSQWLSSGEWFLNLENSRIQKTLRTFLFHQILLGSKRRKIGN